MKFVKVFKKNQVIIYVIALMLVVAGYLNYTGTKDLTTATYISSSEEELAEVSNIGDAQLVSSNVVSENILTESNIINDSVNNTINTNNNTNTNMNNIANSNNQTLDNTVTTSSNIKKTDSNYFSSSRLERDSMYSQMIETYENILNSNNSLETQKQSAQEEIVKINSIKNSIMICENLIKTKEFEDVVIFVNKDSVSVIVKDEQLSPEEVAQIQNIVSREIDVKVENIHISNK